MTSDSESAFDPFDKERQLQEESAAWDTGHVTDAEDDDIPLIDVGQYFADPTDELLAETAERLKVACEEVGFLLDGWTPGSRGHCARHLYDGSGVSRVAG